MTELPNKPSNLQPQKRKSSFLRTAKAILWSFVGLRSRSDYEKDIEQLNTVHIVIAGLIGVMLFVASLFLVVTWVVGK